MEPEDDVPPPAAVVAASSSAAASSASSFAAASELDAAAQHLVPPPPPAAAASSSAAASSAAVFSFSATASTSAVGPTPADVAAPYRKPDGPVPMTGTGRATWDCQVGCWRAPDGSRHEIRPDKKRKLDAAAQRVRCAQIDRELRDDAASAAADAAAAKLVADTAAAAATASAAVPKFDADGYPINKFHKLFDVDKQLARDAAASAAHEAARRAAALRTALPTLDLLTLDQRFGGLFRAVPCLHCLQHCYEGPHTCPDRSWRAELRSALEGALMCCRVEPGPSVTHDGARLP